MCTIINTVTVVFLKLLFSDMKCNNESNRICVHDLGTEKWVLSKSVHANFYIHTHENSKPEESDPCVQVLTMTNKQKMLT